MRVSFPDVWRADRSVDVHCDWTLRHCAETNAAFTPAQRRSPGPSVGERRRRRPPFGIDTGRQGLDGNRYAFINSRMGTTGYVNGIIVEA